MTSDYTKVHFAFESLPNLLNPRKKLNLQGVAVGVINLKPGQGYTFTHSHREQEELYMVIKGSGQIYLDGTLESVEKGDFIRVSPHVRRALKASQKGLFIICAGGVPAGYPKNENARYLIDDGIPYYDDIPPWSKDDPEASRRNARLAERMAKSMSRTQKTSDK